MPNKVPNPIKPSGHGGNPVMPRIPTPSGHGGNFIPRPKAPKGEGNRYYGGMPGSSGSGDSQYGIKAVDKPPAWLVPAKKYSGGGGSAVTSSAVASAPVDPNKATNDMLDALYATLTGQVKETGAKNSGLYDAAMATINGNYEKSNSDIYKQYAGSRDSLTGAANNLGVDYAGSEMGQGYDLAMRRLQEMSDSNRNSDQSYLEKLKLLDQQGIASLLTGIQQEVVDKKAQAAKDLLEQMLKASSKSSGGGGGSRSGGGSSSGKVSTKGTETMTTDNVGDIETYQALKATNPAAAQAYYNAYWKNEGDPKAAIASLMNVKPQSSFFNPAALLKNVKTKATNTAAIQALQGLTSLFGNTKVQQKVVQTGSKKV